MMGISVRTVSSEGIPKPSYSGVVEESVRTFFIFVFYFLFFLK